MYGIGPSSTGPIGVAGLGYKRPGTPTLGTPVAGPASLILPVTVVDGVGPLTELRVYRTPRPLLVYDFTDGTESLGNGPSLTSLGEPLSGGLLPAGGVLDFLGFPDLGIDLSGDFTLVVIKSVTDLDGLEGSLFNFNITSSDGSLNWFADAFEEALYYDLSGYVYDESYSPSLPISNFSAVMSAGTAAIRIDSTEVASDAFAVGTNTYCSLSISNTVGSGLDRIAVFSGALTSGQIAAITGSSPIPDTLLGTFDPEEVEVSPGVYSLEVEGLTPDEEYVIVVVAVNAGGVTRESNEESGTPATPLASSSAARIRHHLLR